MTRFFSDPRLLEIVVGLGLLLAAYLGARGLAYVLARFVARAARRTETALDDRLVAALERPVTYALFVAGATLAVERLPLPPHWIERLGSILFVAGAVLVAVALVRAYGILLSWYTSSVRAGGEFPATEFGPLLHKVGRVFIALVATIVILQRLHVDVASLVVSLGVGSLAIGLAAQDTLANMFAGFTLMLDRPFKLGDRIQLASGEVGDVEAIGIRATRIRTVEETLLVVPNAAVVKERLVNLSRPGATIVTRLEVPVAYGSDLGHVREVLLAAVRETPRVHPDEPALALATRFADYAVIFTVVFQALNYREQAIVRGAVLEAAYRRLAEAGIEIPYPTRRIIHERAEAAGAEGVEA